MDLGTPESLNPKCFVQIETWCLGSVARVSGSEHNGSESRATLVFTRKSKITKALGGINLSRRHFAITVSVVAHAVLLTVLCFRYLPRGSESSQNQPVATNASEDDRLATPPPPPPPESTEDVDEQQIERAVQSQIDAVSQIPDEQKRSELDRNLKRLQSMTDEQSVVETSRTIASALGLNAEAYAEKNPDQKSDSTTPFETDSAQLEDVVRIKTDDGDWRYESVLIDANGRKLTVPMGKVDGESAYQTFQTMKQYPMAQQIYRGVVMPMLQKMMEAEELADQATKAAEQIKAQETKADSLEQVPAPAADSTR